MAAAGPRVLVVDDDALVLRVVARLLEASSFRVTATDDPADAWERFAPPRTVSTWCSRTSGCRG